MKENFDSRECRNNEKMENTLFQIENFVIVQRLWKLQNNNTKHNKFSMNGAINGERARETQYEPTQPTPCIFYSWFSSGISLWALPYNLLILHGIWPYYAHFHIEFSHTKTHIILSTRLHLSLSLSFCVVIFSVFCSRSLVSPVSRRFFFQCAFFVSIPLQIHSRHIICSKWCGRNENRTNKSICDAENNLCGWK